MAGTGEQPLSGDTTTVKQVGRDFGPSQRFTMDWSNIDGSTENIVLGESGNPLSPYFRDQWNDYYGGTTFALPFTPAAVAAADHAYAAIAAMKKQGSGISEQGSESGCPRSRLWDLGSSLDGAAFAGRPWFCSPPRPPLRRNCCAETPAATTSIFTWSPGSIA